MLHPLSVEEEKCLVSSVVQFRNPDRSADLETIFIVLQEGNRIPLVENLCLQMIVLVQFVDLPVEMIGSALGHQFHDARSTVLRIPLRGDDFDFLEGWSGLRILLQFIRISVGHALAIHQEIHGSRRHPVDASIACARSAIAAGHHAQD